MRDSVSSPIEEIYDHAVQGATLFLLSEVSMCWLDLADEMDSLVLSCTAFL